MRNTRRRLRSAPHHERDPGCLHVPALCSAVTFRLAALSGTIADGHSAPMYQRGMAFGLEPVPKPVTVMGYRGCTMAVRHGCEIRRDSRPPLAPRRPWLPPEPPKPKGGRPRVPDRTILAGILYRLRTGCQWQALPPEFGSGSTCH